MSWFSKYVFNRKQYVAIDRQSFETHAILCGVPQESILGPLMFILIINDIESNLKLCNISLYADDTVLFYATERKRCTPAHWGLEYRRMEYSKSRCQNSDLGKNIKCFPT